VPQTQNGRFATLCHPERPSPCRFRQFAALTTGLTACAVTLPGQPRFDSSGPVSTPRLPAVGGGCRGSRGPSDSQPPATDSEDPQRPRSDDEGAIAARANLEHRTGLSACRNSCRRQSHQRHKIGWVCLRYKLQKQKLLLPPPLAICRAAHKYESSNVRYSASGVEPCNPDVGQLTTSNHRHSPTVPGHQDGAEEVARRVVLPGGAAVRGQHRCS